MTTNNLQPITANELSGLVTKQKNRQSSLLSLPIGECTVKTTGSGANKTIALFKAEYTDRNGQKQIYPVCDVNNQAVALSALQTKDSVIVNGTPTARPGIVDAGSTYDMVVDALKANGYKFNLDFVTGRCNGFFGRYAIVTK